MQARKILSDVYSEGAFTTMTVRISLLRISNRSWNSFLSEEIRTRKMVKGQIEQNGRYIV